MKFIAHRGNLNGPNEKENHPEYINEAIKRGFHVEIDVWKINDTLFLGHDMPQYEIDLNFLNSIREYLYAHAKNIPALQYLIQNNINCFSHNVDDAVLTLRGEIWTYPGKLLTSNSICVMPEMYMKDLVLLKNENILGICSDYVGMIKESQ